MIGLIIIEEYGLSVVADGQTEGESDLGFVIVGSVLFFQPLRFFIGEPFRFAAAFRIVRAVIVYGKSIFASGAVFLFAAGGEIVEIADSPHNRPCRSGRHFRLRR